MSRGGISLTVPCHVCSKRGWVKSGEWPHVCGRCKGKGQVKYPLKVLGERLRASESALFAIAMVFGRPPQVDTCVRVLDRIVLLFPEALAAGE